MCVHGIGSHVGSHGAYPGISTAAVAVEIGSFLKTIPVPIGDFRAPTTDTVAVL